MRFSVPFFVGGHFLWVFGPVPFTFGPEFERLALTFRQIPFLRGSYSVGMPSPVPGLGGQSLRLFRREVYHVVVTVIVVLVVGVLGGNIIVAFPVVGWGSATVAAAAWRHRAMVVVLAGVLRTV